MADHASITRAEYDAIQAINWSSLKRGIGKTAAHMTALAGPDKPAYKFGRAFHHAVLQPDEFAKWAIVDGKTTTKEGAITTAEHDAIVTMAEHAGELHGGRFSHVEHCITWDRGGRKCRGLIDAIWTDQIGGKWLCDLKSSQNAEPGAFKGEVFKFKYHGQMAWYLDGLAANGINVNGAMLLAVEKIAPYAAGMYALSDAWIDLGRQLCDEALAILDDGQTGYGHCDLDVPEWAQPGLTINEDGGIDL